MSEDLKAAQRRIMRQLRGFEKREDTPAQRLGRRVAAKLSALDNEGPADTLVEFLAARPRWPMPLRIWRGPSLEGVRGAQFPDWLRSWSSMPFWDEWTKLAQATRGRGGLLLPRRGLVWGLLLHCRESPLGDSSLRTVAVGRPHWAEPAQKALVNLARAEIQRGD